MDGHAEDGGMDSEDGGMDGEDGGADGEDGRMDDKGGRMDDEGGRTDDEGRLVGYGSWAWYSATRSVAWRGHELWDAEGMVRHVG